MVNAIRGGDEDSTSPMPPTRAMRPLDALDSERERDEISQNKQLTKATSIIYNPTPTR